MLALPCVKRFRQTVAGSFTVITAIKITIAIIVVIVNVDFKFNQYNEPAFAMPGQVTQGIDKETTPAPDPSPSHHIELVEAENHSERGEGQPSPGLRDSKGWDGKLRIDRNALLQNPEAISDPEYSDEENVLQGEEISADEGK